MRRKSGSAAGLMVALTVMAATSQSADFSAWTYKLPLTFTGYGQADTLTNFPALVIFSTNITGFSYSDFLSGTNADLRFAGSNQTDELNYEIGTWDTNGSSYVWVQVPALSGTNTPIYAYWGKSGATAPVSTTNGATWSADYVSVFHFDETGGSTAYDACSNGHDGTLQGNATRAAGCIANGLDSAA